jgi:hypothetical protein
MEGLLKSIDAKVDALKQELFDEFQWYLGSVLLEISQKHNLNLEELQGEYLSCSDGSGSDSGSEVKAKRAPAKRKAAKVSGDDKVKCTATTAKGAPCKNLALTGGVLCACHSKSKPPKNSRVDKIRRDVNKGRVKPVSPPSSDSESEEEVPKVVVKKVPPKKAEEVQVTRRPGVRREVAEMKKVVEEIDALFESGGEEEEEESVGENTGVGVSQEVAAEIDALFESGGEEEEEEEESDEDEE